jgi:uncharacterized protein
MSSYFHPMPFRMFQSHRLKGIGIALLLIASLPLAQATSDPTQHRASVPMAQVSIEDSFWAPKLKICRERMIPHSWNYMGWELRALKKANGMAVEGDLNGTWGEANLYKFLETVSYSLGTSPDPALQQRADEVIQLLRGAQQPDGYLHAFITNNQKPKWDPEFLDGSHDGYVLGHLIQAALAWKEGTGKTNFLEIACRAADEAYNHFLGPHGTPGFCGHAELEMALVELYRVVPERRYLDLAKAFVEWRGRNKVKPCGDTPRAYFQDQLPVREQKTLEGHAVRAIFFATGVADLALETGDVDYRLAANRFWASTTQRRMNIAGSIGPRKEREAIGEDYELPNDGYYESCAACGLADFAQRMFLLEGKSDYVDILERVLYNAVLHGISLDGTNSYYMNPLSDHDNQRYNSWVCCPPNLSRTLLKVPRYAYATGPGELFVNLYVAGTCQANLAGGPVLLRVQTDYPWNGSVHLEVHPTKKQRFALNLRLPKWCRNASLALNQENLTNLPRAEIGYLRIEREWQSGDTIALELQMPVELIEAHPNVLACSGKVALQGGPVVYGFEGLDNAGNADVELAHNAVLETEFRPGFLGGVTTIKTSSAGGQALLAVPFYALANREKSTQEVWVRQNGLKPRQDWWLGELYRPVYEPVSLPKAAK